MATKLTAPIHANKVIKVTFQNDHTTGIVLLTAGWVPAHQRMEPQSRSIAIAPKAKSSIDLVVPDFADVRRLSITVSLDDGEAGWIELFEGDREVVSEPVRTTTSFQVPVDA